MALHARRFSIFRKITSVLLSMIFSTTFLLPRGYAQLGAQSALNLPPVGQILSTTPTTTPPMIQGITLDAQNPLRIDFIVDTGDAKLTGDDLPKESMRLIKYFLSSLTIPENELWVNLSPYEKDRIISKDFSKTEMGRDMLAQDYILKQLTASLTHPEQKLGNAFWQRVYARAEAEFGTTQIPMNTFNKVWIIPDKAVVLEENNTAYVVESRLKVMLEEDYTALKANLNNETLGLNKTPDKAAAISGVSSQVVREILIPEIEKEVNQGQNFANLRQIYNAMILAVWYKKNLKESLLGQVYVDQNKTKGIDTNNPSVNQEIYEQYLEAFKKGAYNYIKEDYDAQTKEVIPRKYFSGGVDVSGLALKLQELTVSNLTELTSNQLANIRHIEATANGKFRVQIVLIENATSTDATNASLTPGVTVIAQRITSQSGATTGEINITNAMQEGANGIIAGHSEARKNLGDSDEAIGNQLNAAHEQGLKTIILAVGETGDERNKDQSESVVRQQLIAALASLNQEQTAKTIVAYEPRWAIQGPDFVKEATPEDAQKMANFIRTTLSEYSSPEIAQKVRIIYGGSVNSKNAEQYLSQKDIDGALPGSASTSVEGFKGIIEAAIKVGAKEGRTPFIAGNWKTYATKNSPSEFADALSALDLSQVEVAIAPSATQIKSLATAMATTHTANLRSAIFKNSDKPLMPRRGFERPEGQSAKFFTNVYNIYSLKGLLKGTLDTIPDEVVNAIREKLEQDAQAGKIRSARVSDYGGDSLDIHLTHNFGALNISVHELMLEAMKAGLAKAKELSLLKDDVTPATLTNEELIQALNVASNEHSITERDAESVVIARLVGATPGAANIKLWHEFSIPGSTSLQKLGLGKSPGFRFRVKKTTDILSGGAVNSPEWEFEISHDRKTKDGIQLNGKNESIPLLALLGQPNDYQITGVYAVEGSGLSPSEPIATVVYQMSNAGGENRITNSAILYRSQSGADAVGGIASIVYDANLVPGGQNGEHFVATMPVSLQEARKAPKEGIANVSVVAYQSRQGGLIPLEAIVDHVGINPQAVIAQQNAAKTLASVFITHQDDQPYLAPHAAEEQMQETRKNQNEYFVHAPRDNEADSLMKEVEERIQSGKLVVITHEKADMGGTAGHTEVPKFMEAVYKASLREYVENGNLTDGSTVNVGDDGHLVLIGDKSNHGELGHQLAFLAFTRAYLVSSANKMQPYGEGQDYQGPEAKAAKKNPYFYSQLNERFFEFLREEMANAYPVAAGFATQMVDTVYQGWAAWKGGDQSLHLAEPFSGNVSQQGIGYARYMADIENGETTYDVIAGDKMGPSALNRLLKHMVFNAVDKGEFKEFGNGLVFEIWDAKAFDENGNVALRDIPEDFRDTKNLALGNATQEDQDFLLKAYTAEGLLRTDLQQADKIELARILKIVGFIPTKRIFLDAKADRAAITRYLADSDRFNIKHVWGKKKAEWDISRPQDYLDKPMLASSITRLGILTGGEYVGKDDPVMVGNSHLLKYGHEFLRDESLIIQGDMNGSHWLAAIPSAKQYAIATTDSHPIIVGLHNVLLRDGDKLSRTIDVYETPEYDQTRDKLFAFNWLFKKAQLGGQFEPYGTNSRTVEGSYELAKILRELNKPTSPFLVSNKKAVDYVRAWPWSPAYSLNFLNAAIAGKSVTTVTNTIPTEDDSVLDAATRGGIDFDSKFLNLQVKRDKQGMPLPIQQQSIQSMKIDGFMPFITNIIPVQIAPLFSKQGEAKTEKLSFNY